MNTKQQSHFCCWWDTEPLSEPLSNPKQKKLIGFPIHLDGTLSIPRQSPFAQQLELGDNTTDLQLDRTEGVFCSWNCALAYGLSHHSVAVRDIAYRHVLLFLLRHCWHEMSVQQRAVMLRDGALPFEPAPSARPCLLKFGGYMSIARYRASFCDKRYKITVHSELSMISPAQFGVFMRDFDLTVARRRAIQESYTTPDQAVEAELLQRQRVKLEKRAPQTLHRHQHHSLQRRFYVRHDQWVETKKGDLIEIESGNGGGGGIVPSVAQPPLGDKCVPTAKLRGNGRGAGYRGRGRGNGRGNYRGNYRGTSTYTRRRQTGSTLRAEDLPDSCKNMLSKKLRKKYGAADLSDLHGLSEIVQYFKVPVSSPLTPDQVFCCWWDGEPIKTAANPDLKPVRCPVRVRDSHYRGLNPQPAPRKPPKDGESAIATLIVDCEGLFCSWNCALAYSLDHPESEVRKHALYSMYSVLLRHHWHNTAPRSVMPIRPAPQPTMELDKYGIGSATIDQFRATFHQLNVYTVNPIHQTRFITRGFGVYIEDRDRPLGPAAKTATVQNVKLEANQLIEQAQMAARVSQRPARPNEHLVRRVRKRDFAHAVPLQNEVEASQTAPMSGDDFIHSLRMLDAACARKNRNKTAAPAMRPISEKRRRTCTLPPPGSLSAVRKNRKPRYTFYPKPKNNQ
jgi:hypothetical protein